MLKRFSAGVVMGVCAIVSMAQAMQIGTNFWDLRWTDSTDCFNNVKNVTGDNPWNPTFLQEIDFYTSLRFMDWDNTNKSSRSSWSQRTQKSNRVQFTAAYEWMIDLCNRVDADMWVCIPHKTVGPNDETKPCDYALRLAILVKTGVDMKNVDLTGMYDNLGSMTAQQFIAAGGVKTCDPLESSQKVYVEYSNEIWNSSFSIKPDDVKKGEDPMNGQYVYCASKGFEKNFVTERTFTRDSLTIGQVWAAWASIRVFKSMELVFGANSPRVVKVLPAYGTDFKSSFWAQWKNIYLKPAVNTWNIKPDVVAIAPYFGKDANGNNSNEAVVWDSLLNSKQSGLYEIIKGSVAYFAKYVNDAGMKLVGYEGGQHMTQGASAINYNPRMYTVYTEYLDSLNKYMPVFFHYTHTGSCGGMCWGAKKKTGSAMNDSPKYKALYDWAKAHPVAVSQHVVTPVRNRIVNLKSAQVFDLHGRRIDATRHSATRLQLVRDETGRVIPRIGLTQTH